MPAALRHTTLRQLQTFLAAAELGSFGRAAQALHLTQPAVSMQMSQLSQALGVALFERRGRRLALTQAGETLMPYVERLTETLKEAGEALDALQGLRRGRLRIALVTTTRYFAPRLAALFREAHAHIDMEVSIAHRDAVIAQLESNHADLAIMGRPPAHLPIVAEPFAQHPHGVIAPPWHPLAGKRRIAPARAADQPFIAREPGCGTRDAMDRYFAGCGIAPAIVQTMPSNESIKQAVMAGMGLAFISLHTVSLEHQGGHLALLDLQGLPVLRDWFVIHRANKPLSPAAEAFKTFVHAQAPAFMKTLLPRAGGKPPPAPEGAAARRPARRA
ncbi:MAG TPA: LysR family transcriptional regulator [Burkholderiaceae bacterium]